MLRRVVLDPEIFRELHRIRRGERIRNQRPKAAVNGRPIEKKNENKSRASATCRTPCVCAPIQHAIVSNPRRARRARQPRQAACQHAKALYARGVSRSMVWVERTYVICMCLRTLDSACSIWSVSSASVGASRIFANSARSAVLLLESRRCM